MEGRGPSGSFCTLHSALCTLHSALYILHSAPMAATLDRESLASGGPIPRHVAVIMDGNGRWARQRGLPRVEGHRRGEQAVHEAVEACGELGIEHLTLYSF